MLLSKDRENLWKVQKELQTSKIYLRISFSGKRTWMETTYPPPAYPTKCFQLRHPGTWNCRWASQMVCNLIFFWQQENLAKKKNRGTESYACNDDETINLNGCWSLFIRPKFILRNDICFGDWLPPDVSIKEITFRQKVGKTKSPSILLWLFQTFLRSPVQFNI